MTGAGAGAHRDDPAVGRGGVALGANSEGHGLTDTEIYLLTRGRGLGTLGAPP